VQQGPKQHHKKVPFMVLKCVKENITSRRLAVSIGGESCKGELLLCSNMHPPC
jgi:hypothetical protein